MADPQPPNVEARQIVRQETKIRQLEEVGHPLEPSRPPVTFSRS